MDALRVPPGDSPVAEPLRRRAAPGGAVPPAAQQAGPAPARRAHQPPRRRERRLARAPPAGVRGDRRRDHPRPVLPRQRRRLDSRARPRQGGALRGQLLRLAGPEAGPPRERGEAGVRAPTHSAARARVGSHVAPRAARRSRRRGCRPTRSSRTRARPTGCGTRRDHDPLRPAAGRQGGRRGRGAQGLRRPAARSTTSPSGFRRVGSSA